MAVGPLLLVHSPLVGPSSWSRLAAVAADSGLEVVVPDLTGIAHSPRPRWRALVDDAVGAAAGLDRITVVGHSGAGALLPIVGERLGRRLGALIFVDAVHPVPEGLHETGIELAALLDAQTTDGRLAPWLDWWPVEVVESLLPSEADRAAIADDLPRLPRDFYDDAVPMPVGWTDGPCAYLQLSGAYADDRERARRLGWPSITLESSHLGIFTEPAPVLQAVLALADEVRRRSS